MRLRFLEWFYRNNKDRDEIAAFCPKCRRMRPFANRPVVRQARNLQWQLTGVCARCGTRIFRFTRNGRQLAREQGTEFDLFGEQDEA